MEFHGVKAMAWVFVAHILGFMVSSEVISADHLYSKGGAEIKVEPIHPIKVGGASGDETISATEREAQFASILKVEEKGDPFASLSFIVHRNGEVDPCGRSVSDSPYQGLRWAMESFVDMSPNKFGKYEVEALITLALAGSLLDNDMCPSLEEEADGAEIGILSFCDMGEAKTPILEDHNKLVPVPWPNGKYSHPCHFHTREGVRVTSLEQLGKLGREAAQNAIMYPEETCTEDQGGAMTCVAKRPELHLYAVPAGRMFIFAPSYVGEIFHLPHVQVPGGLPVALEVLSLSPRVFDIYNFFSREESAGIVEKALKETSESHRIKRSSTGASGYNLNARRTSENGFDTHGKTAMAVKRRCFDVLGFDEFLEGHADGLQVLRYNKTTAYIPHLDWIDDYEKKEEHNFDSAGVGGNRFATILLYMTDMEEGAGGETVFANAWPPGQSSGDHKETLEALRSLRESGDADMLAKGSWEEKMVAQCRSRLAIRPHSSRAVLFYSQHPNGVPDEDSLHGGCPVLSGEKWAANLWVWNTPRGGFAGSPVNEEVVKKNRKEGIAPVGAPSQLHATFRNLGNDPRFAKAELFFQETFWGPFGHDDPPLAVNTFEGHKWNVQVNGRVLRTWTMTNAPKQVYSI